MANDRRDFLKALGAGALASALPTSIERALALPARKRHGSIKDVEHIVILMQENRSFDHYFGTLRGVRGFGDPRAVNLPSGAPVWFQPDGKGGDVAPFRPEVINPGLQFIEDVPHGWNDGQRAWNQGKYDQWIPNKGTTAMTYFTRQDIPFQFALADAFTVCDAYYCSFMGATDPNRYHMWTGWTGNDGKNGGPVLNNAEAGYDWFTYPERLQKAGVSWKIYQDAGLGLDSPNYWGWGPPHVGNYGDNSLLYFHQYQNAAPGTALHENAFAATKILQRGTLFDMFKADVAADTLPQVSWITSPEAYSEHPNWLPSYGAWYTSQILDALTANPEVWAKTATFYCFDEGGGFFDHMVSPTPPTSRAQGLSTVDTVNEIFAGHDTKHPTYVSGPYGLGVRVPMIVISPWSKGGWVNSEVFDHTSLIRFIEERFGRDYHGLTESNITPWRRAVTGDLTSTFDFKSSDANVVSLPSTTSYAPTDLITHDDYKPVPPKTQALALQEPGVRPARAVPYRLTVETDADFEKGTIELRFGNRGKAAAVFQVRAGDGIDGPWTYTVGPRTHVTESWPLLAKGQTGYDLSVYGPNGFFRAFKGSIQGRNKANLRVESRYDEDSTITLKIENHASHVSIVRVFDAYSKRSVTRPVLPGRSVELHWDLERSYGWYDLTIEVVADPNFKQVFAGHVESGRDSMTDPALGA